MPDDVVKERPAHDFKREWEHGDQGLGQNCPRNVRPVFTDPDKVPNICRGIGCTNEEWRSKGVVERIHIKDESGRVEKKVIVRDGKTVSS